MGDHRCTEPGLDSERWDRLSSCPLRRSDEWEQVEIDAFALWLLSRISTELSYFLSTFALITLARGHYSQQHGERDREGGFPIVQAPDFWHEVIDLVQDIAFDGVEVGGDLDHDAPLVMRNELVDPNLDESTKLFAAPQTESGVEDLGQGPR